MVSSGYRQVLLEGDFEGTVNVRGNAIAACCAGTSPPGTPTVVLLAGMPDPLTRFRALQERLAVGLRVCCYDRLGEGASAKPSRSQTPRSSAELLHALLAEIAPNATFVLVGHSLGGLIAAEFAHLYPPQVHALVLLDATPPTVVRAIPKLIPADAGGLAAEVRSEMTSLATGKNPERLVYRGEPLGSLQSIPVTVVRHGAPVLSAMERYGPRLEQLWSSGQKEWTNLSAHSVLVTASTSGHYIHVDQPELVERLVRQAAAERRGRPAV